MPRRGACQRDPLFLTGTASDPRFGSVTVGPTMDPEVSAGSPACGELAVYTALIKAAGGTMNVTETGPRLCLYSTSAVPRHFTVVTGTGHTITLSAAERSP